MQSDGGLADVDDFSGSRAILSGPAGGVIGYALTGYDPATRTPVVGFDMGGTSTDVSRYAGSFDHVTESVTAGVIIQAPQLDINTVAAGGGSRLLFHNGMLVVGPESAGSDPGPSCYRKGGPLAITDANLVLGRLQPDYFPRIFGANRDEQLDAAAPLSLFQGMLSEVAASGQGSSGISSVHELALGFIRVANEAMSRPIREMTSARGFDIRSHVLSGGGAWRWCMAAVMTITIMTSSMMLPVVSTLVITLVCRQCSAVPVVSMPAPSRARSEYPRCSCTSMPAC
jgi:5-oxoprolinase (ATP-hydrolysing)